MPDTLGSMRAEILRWLRGDLQGTPDDATQINDAINDAIESIWNSIVQVQLSRLIGLDSPVSFALSTGNERVQLVTIADPTVAPAAANVVGGALPARNSTLGYTYVTESGSETNQSPTTIFAASLNNLIQVTAPAQVAGAIGWNLYAGSSALAQGLQNQNPLPFGQPFTEPITGFVDYPGAQQQPPASSAATTATPAAAPPPSANTTADNIGWISHLEVRTSDTLLRTWNQYTLDSEPMRRLGRTLSSASEYQTYAWDLINGNRLEFRPAMGSAFNPRYFYVVRPRRLRYDQGNIMLSLQQITGVHEFIRNYAVHLLKLALDEYLSHQGFGTASEKNRQEIVLAVNQENWSKDIRITPHLW